MSIQEQLENAVIRDNPFPNYCGIRIAEVRQDYCKAEVDLKPEILNPFGYAHGGLLMTLADCCASTAARTDGHRYVTLNSNLHFIRNTQNGCIHAVSSVVSRGGTISIVHVEVRDENELLLCDGTMTMFRMKER